MLIASLLPAIVSLVLFIGVLRLSPALQERAPGNARRVLGRKRRLRDEHGPIRRLVIDHAAGVDVSARDLAK